MSQTPSSSPPGWHPDPWDPAGSWRFWDGATWTGHTAPRSGADPAALLTREVQSAGWARWAVVGTALITLASSFALPAEFHWLRDEIRRISDAGLERYDGFHTPASMYLLQVVAFAQMGLMAPMLIWQYRANLAAQSLGLRLTRTPAWGVGSWFVPVVNFWFPYEAVRDNLPPGHPDRPRVLRWWVGWYANAVLSYVAAAGWLLEPALGVALWIAFATYLGWWVSTSRRMIDSVSTAHRELAASQHPS